MKKHNIIIVIIFFCCLFLINLTYAYSDWTQSFITPFEEKLVTLNKEQKLQYLKVIETIISAPKVKANKSIEVQRLVSEISERLQIKRDEINSSKVNIANYKIKNSDNTSYQVLSNIDFDEVRKKWLSRHNQEREKLWLSPYTYHSDLEKSAVNRALYLAKNSIKSWTHARKSTDGYYSYDSIKNWFWSLGIYFPKETWWRAAFTESVGYRIYNCNQSDCTQKLIEATKKVFDWFVSEWKNGAHYKAIVMPHFKQIWVGFAYDSSSKMVYTVIHYAWDLLWE